MDSMFDVASVLVRSHQKRSFPFVSVGEHDRTTKMWRAFGWGPCPEVLVVGLDWGWHYVVIGRLHCGIQGI